MAALATLIERIRAEYLALPGLKLTPSQARRLWAATDEEFRAAMEALVAEGFLRHLPSGTYIAMPRPLGAAAKAELPPAQRLFRCPHCRKRNAVQREQTLTGNRVVATLRCAGCGRVVTVSAVSA